MRSNIAYKNSFSLARFGLGLTACSLDYYVNTMISGYNHFYYSGFSQKVGVGTMKRIYRTLKTK